MLNFHTKNKKSKLSDKSEASLRKGLMFIKGKLFKQATVELKIALNDNPVPVAREIEIQFNRYNEEGETESALTLGLVLLSVKKSASLANKLGNFSRIVGNYNQANNLYKQSLRINKSYKEPFYNLAASMGKVRKYDMAIREMIDRNFVINEYILPRYIATPDVISNIEQQLICSSENPSGHDVRDTLQTRIAAINENDCSSEEKESLYRNIFNLGIYSLSRKDPETALDSFLKLKSKNIDFDYLLMGIAIATEFNGFIGEAIPLMLDALKEKTADRIINANLALMYKKKGNRLLECKYSIVTSALLEDSEGLFHMSAIMDRADELFKLEEFDRALKLYKIVADNTKNVTAWLCIGDILFLKKRYSEAISTFNEILKLDPESEIVKSKLVMIHHKYSEKADKMFNERKFSQAAVLYQRAHKLVHVPETVEKLISVYKRLNKNELIPDLYEEQQRLTQARRDIENEKKRQLSIMNGKLFLKKGEYESAITSFEEAFKMKADKDVFVFLAHIYKKLKRPRMLQSLMDRWNMMSEQEERQKKRAD